MLASEQIEHLLLASQPRGTWERVRIPILLGAGLIAGALVASPTWANIPPPIAAAIPLLMLLLALTGVRWDIRRQVRHTQRQQRIEERILLERWEEAEREMLDLLSRPMRSRQSRARTLGQLARLAEHHQLFESSRLIYSHLLADDSLSVAEQRACALGLAATLVRTDHITDAVELISRLVRADLPEAWQARVELLQLFGEASMGQYEDIVDRTEHRRKLFRDYLSVRSGYGYALMALGHHYRRGDGGVPEVGGDGNKDGDTGSGGARALWHDATMLIAPQKLLRRYPMLQVVADNYEPAERLI